MLKRPMLQQSLHLGRFALRRLFLASVLALLAFGCGGTQLPEPTTVADVTLLETSPSELDTDDALAGLATAAPRKILWFVVGRDAYDANLVARDLERVERYYRAHGYYDVKVVAARVEKVGERRVEIEVHVTPGPRVTVRKVDYDPPRSTYLEASAVLINVKEIKAGEPFEEARLDERKRELEQAFKESGYAYVKVNVRAKVDLSTRSADIVTEVQPGKLARFGKISIVGLSRIPESKVRAALELKQGDRYSELEMEDARDALNAMNLFTRVEVTPDLSSGSEDVPILVTVQEDKLRKLTLGGGTLLDALKLEMHVRTGWEHRNFFGGARRFSVDGSAGVVLYPMRLENLETLAQAPSNLFLILSGGAKLEQPSIFGGRTRGSIEARYSRSPVLYSLEDRDASQEVVIGFHKPSGRLALHRAFWGHRITMEPSYNLVARLPFFYQNSSETGLETLWVSYPALWTKIESKRGDLSQDEDKRDLILSFQNSLEIAGAKIGGRHLLGGSVSDIKIQPELSFQFPIFGKKRNKEQRYGNLMLAARFKVGFILAPDYGESLRTDVGDMAVNDPDTDKDQQKLLARAFFSGGDKSNRGYTLGAISPHGPVGFLQPTRINCGLPEQRNDSSCIRPLGGFTLWEASLELRVAVLYPVTLVAFLDGSDVTRDVGRLQFRYPHLSAGPGVRYESPVGPLRLDFGIRLPGLQAIGEESLPLSHGRETPDFFGIPAAIHLAFGESFSFGEGL